MPILDKLTTIINWKVDDSELGAYENQLNQASVAQNRISSGSKKAASSIGVFSDEIDSTSGFLDELGKKTTVNVKNVARLGSAAEQAGDGVDSLGNDARGTGRDIDSFASRANKATRAAGNIDNAVDEAGRGFDDFGSEITSTASSLLKFGSIATGIVTTLGIMSSKELTKNIRLAESVGMTQDAYLGWEGVLKGIGFEGEKAVDLVEEMNNKIGELSKLGKMSSAQDAFKMLGIEFKKIKDLAPEEQFMQIMQAAKTLDDEQIAASAVDMIMGGDANKIVGLLRTYDGSVKDILKTHRDMNFVTAEGIAGSMALTNSWNNLETAGTSLFTEVTGRAGEALSPMINGLLEWATANKALINQNIGSVVEGITDSFRWLAWAGGKAKDAIDSMGGIGNTFKTLAAGVVAWKAANLVTSLSGTITAFGKAAKGAGVFNTALKLLGKTPLVLLFAAAGLALQDLYVFMKGGKSFFGDWSEKLIPDVENALLSLAGVISDDMTLSEKQIAIAEWQQSFLGAVDTIVDGYGTVVDATTDAIDWSVKAWDKYAPAAEAAGQAVFDFYKNGYEFLGSLVTGYYTMMIDSASDTLDTITGLLGKIDDFFGGHISAMLDRFKGFISGIANAIGDIPLIGSIFGDSSPEIPSSPIGNAVATLPTSGAVPSVSTQKNGDYFDSSSLEINSPITINQAPGQSSQDVAREVTDQLKQQFSAVKKTGIKR